MGQQRQDFEGRVPQQLGGGRLERVLQELLFEETRSGVARLVKRGAVRVDGALVTRTGQRLRAGQLLQVQFARAQRTREERGLAPRTKAPALVVVYEDEHLAVVDKPAGLLMHPKGAPRDTVRGGGRRGGAGGRVGGGLDERDPVGQLGRGRRRQPRTEPTLADLAEERFGRLPRTMGVERPGIVHRLDRGTSGLVAIARSAEAMDGLRAAFRAREVQKAYLAVVHGDPAWDETVLDWDLVDGADDRRGWRAAGSGEQSARTEVEVLERYGHVALVVCRPSTGRRHQLRVHLCAAGLPIVGDDLYAGRRAPELPRGAPRARRVMLHAAGLAFQHPISAEPFEFEAGPPDDVLELLGWFEG
ncbi:MAG: RluA family pseudouridine synthase [Planctomycetota bacterium]|nr:RluA family pseudouridine synthase [Planctomycetota bacterium]